MLVLSRKVNERILIGDDIFIEVVQIDKSKVRIGISAPKEVVVLRQELVLRRQQGEQSNKENS